MLQREKDWFISVTESKQVCNGVESHCLKPMMIMHHHINPSRETLTLKSGLGNTKDLRLSILWGISNLIVPTV